MEAGFGALVSFKRFHVIQTMEVGTFSLWFDVSRISIQTLI